MNAGMMVRQCRDEIEGLHLGEAWCARLAEPSSVRFSDLLSRRSGFAAGVGPVGRLRQNALAGPGMAGPSQGRC